MMKISLYLAVCLGGICTVLPAQERRHLFLDPAFVQESKGTTLKVNPPISKEIVIRHDQPWEQLMITFFTTVREEEGKLRLWYTCRDKMNQPNVAYAESTDGVNWVKPNLGIVDYEGSKENNLVGMSSLEGVVFRDPKAPDAERYAYITHLIEEGMVRFHSPDGMHWGRDAKPVFPLGADTQNVTFFDQRLGKYVMYLRGWYKGDKNLKYRKVVRAELDSITTPFPIGPSETSMRLWGKDKNAVIEEQLPTVFAADDLDPVNTDVYNISAQPYALDNHWYVGFPSMFQREKTTSDGRLEMHFTGSTDGIHWHRYDRSPYVRLGMKDADDQNMVFMGTGMVVRGDEIWQYGVGLHARHGDREERKQRTDGMIYRYVQRVDGFVSLDFANEGGEAITAPVKVETNAARLLLNVDTAALGKISAGLCDAAGKPIPGYDVMNCDVIRINETGATVTWKGNADLAALAGQEVRVKFSGARARLFSFRFAPVSP